MGNLESILLLIVSGQGILISLALIAGVFRKKYANFFLGLITVVITIEIFTIWAIKMQLTNTGGIFPIWILGSYLILPPALWLFVRVNLNPTFVLRKLHWLVFVPAIIEIVVEAEARATEEEAAKE